VCRDEWNFTRGIPALSRDECISQLYSFAKVCSSFSSQFSQISNRQCYGQLLTSGIMMIHLYNNTIGSITGTTMSPQGIEQDLKIGGRCIMEKYFGEWIPYSGNSAIILGVILLVIAGVFTLFGFKIKKSLRVEMPGKAIAAVLVAVWILSILTFLVNIGVYSILLQQAKFAGTIPNNPIKVTKYTLYSLAGMFFVFAIWGFLSFFFCLHYRISHFKCSRQSIGVCYRSDFIPTRKESRRLNGGLITDRRKDLNPIYLLPQDNKIIG
jgi:hypothetical protein